jgi:HAD superfamily hydrolase (TIGR01549 family)
VRVPVFDLDGTLVDSDEALVAAFVALGVPREQITFGHVLADECARLGLDVDRYLEQYDETLATPFSGVTELLDQLPRWAVCSNKHPAAGHAELRRLGWRPEVALFSDSFGGPKQIEPVLTALGVRAEDVVFVGDTAHDRLIARAAGVPFGLAGWNARARQEPDDVVLRDPLQVLEFCREPFSPKAG